MLLTGLRTHDVTRVNTDVRLGKQLLLRISNLLQLAHFVRSEDFTLEQESDDAGRIDALCHCAV